MAVTKEELNIKVSVSFKDGKRVIKEITGEFKDLEDQLGDTSKATDKAGRSFTKTSADVITLNQALELSRKAFQVLAKAVDFTVANFARFEKGLIGVVKTANLTAEQTKIFSDEISQLALDIPATTSELFEIAKAAGQLGVEAEELTNFTETIVRLGASADVAGEEAALATSRILGLTRTPTSEIDEFASALVALGNNLRANEAEILRTTTVIAQGIGTFGASADAVVALGAASRDLGIRFELAGSAITRSFIEINRNITEGGDQLKKLSLLTGIAAEDFEEAFGADSVGVFRKFLEGLGQIEQTKVPIVLKSLGLEGVEINRVIPTLAKNLDRLDLAFGLASEEIKEATALTQESDRAFQVLQSQITKMSNAFNRIGVVLGQFFAPALQGAVQGITKLLKSVGDLIADLPALEDVTKGIGNAFRDIDWDGIASGIARVGIAVGGALAAFNVGAITAVVNKLTLLAFTSLPIVIAGFKAAAGAAIKFVAAISPVVIGAGFIAAKFTAVALVIDLVIQNISKLDALFRVVVESIVGGVAKLGASFFGLFSDISDGAAEVSKNLEDFGRLSDAHLTESFEQIDTTSIDFIAEKIAGLTTDIVKAEDSTNLLAKAMESIDDKPLKDVAAAASSLDPRLQSLLDMVGKETKDSNELLQKQANILRQLETQNMNLNTQILNVGATQKEQIDNNLRLQEDLINKKMRELEAQKLLTPEIEKQLQMQKDLLNLKADADKQQVDFEQAESTALFDTGALETISAGMGEQVAGFAGAVSSFASPVTAFAAAGNIILDGIQQLIDLIPNLLNKFADVVNSLVDLPNQLVAAVSNVVDSLISLVADLIPNVIKAIPEILTKLFVELPRGIEAAFIGLLDALPQLIFDMIDSLLAAVPEFVAMLISAVPRMAIALVSFLVRDAPKIAFAITKAMAIDLPIAIVKGIIQGIQEIAKAIEGFFTGGFDIDPLKEQVQEFADEITGVAGQLFEVKGLAEEARAADQAEKFREAISSGGRSAMDMIIAAWRKVWDWFKNIFGPGVASAWRAILNFFEGFGGLISSAWKSIMRFFGSLPELIGQAWAGIVDFFSNFGLRISEAWKAVFEFFTDKIGPFISRAWQGIMDFFGSLGMVFKDLGIAIWDGLSSAGEGIISFFSGLGGKIWEGLRNLGDAGEGQQFFKNKGNDIWQGLKSFGSDLGNFFFDLGKKLSEGIKQGVKDLGGKIADFFGFNHGGLVPGFNHGGMVGVQRFANGGPVGFGTDSVPSLLTPGEFVINRPAVNAVGTDFLNQINQGRIPQMGGGGTSVSIGNININTTNKVDEDFIRNRMMPTLKAEFKRASLDGEFVISARGIR